MGTYIYSRTIVYIYIYGNMCIVRPQDTFLQQQNPFTAYIHLLVQAMLDSHTNKAFLLSGDLLRSAPWPC